jgi:hypothetical protein
VKSHFDLRQSSSNCRQVVSGRDLSRSPHSNEETNSEDVCEHLSWTHGDVS